MQPLFRDSDGQGLVACSSMHIPITGLIRNLSGAAGMTRFTEHVALFLLACEPVQPRSLFPNLVPARDSCKPRSVFL